MTGSFLRLARGTVVDTSPAARGGFAKAWDLDSRTWKPYSGTVRELMEGTPITDSEAKRLISSGTSVKQRGTSLPRVDLAQPMFDCFRRTPKEVCDQIGLPWFPALDLAADGYLSFSPDQISVMDEGQDAELSFVGTLAVWANDRFLLDRLLSGLQKPYCYRLDRIWYNWKQGEWQAFPEPHEPEEPENAFADWLDGLAAGGDTERLLSIRERVEATIRQAHSAGN